MSAYDELMKKYGEISLLDSTTLLLAWDMETYMPPGGVGLRGDQLSLVERLRHRMLTNPNILRLIDECEKESGSFDEVQSRSLYLLSKEVRIATSMPEDLVAAYTKQTAISRDAWARARNAKDWKVFEPELQKMVDLSIMRAEATMDARGVKTVYDAMIDDFEPGMTSEKAAEVLTELRQMLIPLTDRFIEMSEGVDTSYMFKPVPIEAQRAAVRDAVNLIGYDTVSDKARGRIDETLHPFTTGYYDDVRIALKYSETGMFDALMGGMHEAGHAMYDQNMDRKFMYTPISHGASMGVHESCSRFMENMIGTSEGFWKYYLPRFKKLVSPAHSDLQLDQVMKGANRVQRSKIRTKADEVTYSIHIAIRSEIERGLFSGKIQVKELPQVWNEMYDKYLQVKIEDDVEGVMQDVHWSGGGYGYFQSYALGNVYDGMYLKKLEKDMPDWQHQLEIGKPEAVVGWLREKVHQWGSLYDPGVLVPRVAGFELSSKPFVEYLEKKYSSIWG